MKYIPKVGEECLWLSPNTGVYHHTKIIHINDESVWLEGEGVVAHDTDRYKPIKTPAEIERDNGIVQMFEDAEVQGSNSAFVRLYDKGYRKQHGKSLSYDKFRALMRPMSFDSYYYGGIYELIKPYLSQGGDK
jgi:hypothetical protein